MENEAAADLFLLSCLTVRNCQCLLFARHHMLFARSAVKSAFFEFFHVDFDFRLRARFQ